MTTARRRSTSGRALISVPSFDPSYGGPTVKAAALSAALRDHGREVLVTGAGHGARTADRLPLGQIGSFHRTPIPVRVDSLASAVRGCEIVHILGYRDPVGTLAAAVARLVAVPYVIEPCGMHRPHLRSTGLKRVFDSLAGRSIVECAARIVATSALERDELVAAGVRSSRIIVRANGVVDSPVAVSTDARDRFRDTHGIPRSAPLVVSIGRIAKKKGLLVLAEALSGLEGVWGLLAGPDDGDGTLPALYDARARFALTPRLVVLEQGLWGVEKAAALSSCDIFCLPSAHENFATAAAEAAAAGATVVITDRCGVVEFLEPGATRVVPFGDVTRLRDAIATSLADSGARERARAAAPTIRKRLDWHALAAAQLAVYDDVLAMRPSV